MFFKKKEKEMKQLLAPVSGKLIAIEKVNDPVFAQKMMGDGFAIEPTGEQFYALADGKISAVFPSNHAYGITLDDGMEILVHIGLETVNENGKGFRCHVQLNDVVKAGDMIMEIDSAYLKGKYDLTTMVIFTNANAYEEFKVVYDNTVVGGKDTAASYR